MTGQRSVLLSEQQLAVALRCDVAALQRMRAAGVGPAYRVLPSGVVLYAPDAVRAWLAGSRNYRDRSPR